MSTRILFAVLGVLILGSIYLTYDRAIVQKDFLLEDSEAEILEEEVLEDEVPTEEPSEEEPVPSEEPGGEDLSEPEPNGS